MYFNVYMLGAVAKRRLYSFWIDETLSDGLQVVRDRDGILPSEQIRRAIGQWLESKGVAPDGEPTKRNATRTTTKKGQR